MTTTAPVEPTGRERTQLETLRGTVLAERRYHVAGIELRAKDNEPNTVSFFGHASVTGKGYDVYGGAADGGWTEFVDQGAFKKTLSESPDVAFLLNHGGMTLARTKSGTLRLAEDKVGLAVDADLDARVSIVNDIRIQMERGDLDEMSFAFRVTRQKWFNADGEEVPWWDLSGIERHITEVSLANGDVSVVNFGANPYTDAALRAAMRAGLADPGVLRRAADEIEPLNSGRDVVDAIQRHEQQNRVPESHLALMYAFYAKRQPENF